MIALGIYNTQSRLDVSSKFTLLPSSFQSKVSTKRTWPTSLRHKKSIADGQLEQQRVSKIKINLIHIAHLPVFLSFLPPSHPSFLSFFIFPLFCFCFFLKKQRRVGRRIPWYFPQADGNILLFSFYGLQTEKGAVEKGMIESKLDIAHLANQ